ncbi:DnaJ family domain-containing protein [Paenibacillus apiarius]|uniref:DUF1992 domain-containing protein n=1 Tax=Paenibacillus apiarius TaxID=46240 RepID=A0ABT4DPC2_9BACL|nr:DnaJ family domain-containing protein [Paenibacillus apiarius]MBN3522512.1 DUF1992 domain-containing protein [Paenibacillus apiarius]MCY9514635.1 DUF1992 domain-containing protein [Paenibacillus apiarius]MCY9518625.1 DUF1992 domain-containing protein [Paenibacillus apiarius]MCY9552713.1 DUF1992 domain-containing protein [Paenibacillus apiarius]MCY9556959.1 DUF1992 domain-containing protein [Paenibacillus apiarius]
MMNSRDWMDEAFANYEKQGGLKDLPGKGKPLDVSSGDALSGVLKEANYLPAWLELQHTIRNQIRALVQQMDQGKQEIGEEQFEQINRIIRKYNQLVPNSLLQKGFVSKAHIKEQLAKWE